MSRDGRWALWSSGTNGQIDDGVHLLDTQTGTDERLTLRGEPALNARVSNDGEYLVVLTESTAALLQTTTRTILTEAALSGGGAYGGAEFASDGTVAVAFSSDSGPRETLILHPNGTTTGFDGGAWPLRWSPDGSLLATTAESSYVIVSKDGLIQWEIPASSDINRNIRWSPGGKYVSIPNDFIGGGYRLFEVTSRREILRTVGSPTCLDYWNADGTIVFDSEGQRLSVPAGDVLPPAADEPAYEYRSAGEVGRTEIELPSGRSVDFKSNNWSAYWDQDGVYRATNDGEVIFFISVGGKGLCTIGSYDKAEVLFPPF